MKLLVFNLRMDRNSMALAFAVDWINALAEYADEVLVITMYSGTYEVHENVRVLSAGKERGLGEVRRAVRFLRLLWGVLRRERCDVCFAHMMPVFAILGAPLLKFRGIPTTLWYVHNTKNFRVWLAEKLVVRVVSSTQGSFPVASKKVIYTGHGIDTERFAPGQGKSAGVVGRPFTVVSVSRISPIKKLDTIIEGMIKALLHGDDGAMQLRVFGKPMVDGDEDYLFSLKKKVCDAGLEGRILFEGPASFLDIEKIYHKADLFINLSPNGLDKAALEAMSCAVPTLVSHEPFRDILGPLVESCFVDPPTSQEIAKAILSMRERSAEERYTLGMSLRALVQRDHSLEQLAERLVAEILPVRRG